MCVYEKKKKCRWLNGTPKLDRGNGLNFKIGEGYDKIRGKYKGEGKGDKGRGKRGKNKRGRDGQWLKI